MYFVLEYRWSSVRSSSYDCSALPSEKIKVLWPRLTSCSSLLLRKKNFFPPARPPRVSVITFTSYICCIYTLKFGQYWTSFCLGNSSLSKCLMCSFCSSDRGFARRDTFNSPHPTSFRLRLTADALVFG